jgi:hypothetical protein
VRDKYLLTLAVLLVAAVLFFLSPSIRGNDGVLNYVYLRSIFFDRDLDFANEYACFDSIKRYEFKFADIPTSPLTGRPVNRYGIGSAILWTPFFLVAHGATTLLKMMGSTLSADGYSFPYVLAISIGSALYASLGILLIFMFLTRYYPRADSFIAALLMWLATPLVFYMYFHPSMSHAHSFFLSAAFIYVYFSPLPLSRLLQWGLLGFLAGLLVATRFQDATLLIIPLAGEIYKAVGHGRDKPHAASGQTILPYFVGLLAFFIVFSPQLLAWKYLYGSYLSGPAPYLQYEGFDLCRPRFVLKVLFSSRHGLLFWHPVLLAGLIGLALRLRQYTLEKVLLFVGFLATLYLVSTWAIWHAGASFGHRMFISVLPISAFGLASLVNSARRVLPRTLLIFLICAIILWNFGLIVQYATGMVPRQAHVSLRTVVRNQFTHVPAKVLEILAPFALKRAAVEKDISR